MKQRRLGRLDMGVSPLGLGTVKLGRNSALRYPRPFALPDDARLAELLDAARDLGINLIDTAPAYGSSEERLGAALHGQRADWVICTKCGEEFADGRSRFDFSPAHTRASVERSLRRLRTDYLDIVLLHSNGDDCAILNDSGALETLRALQQAGLVRAIGISTKTVAGALAAAPLCDVLMLTWNPQYRDEEAALAHAATSGCAVLVKKALASGLCATDLQDSLDFLYAQPAVASVIIGTIDLLHLRANAAAAVHAIARAGHAADTAC